MLNKGIDFEIQILVLKILETRVIFLSYLFNF